ncbi:MAG: hypothetical protein ABII12_00950 [Planctomycetota bacterium]
MARPENEFDKEVITAQMPGPGLAVLGESVHEHTFATATQGPADEPAREAAGHPSKVRRRVLVIASRFPPVASVGAIRLRKFAKYLRRYGWDSVVITGATRRGAVSSHDARRATDAESLLDLPDDLPVYRLSPVLDSWPSYLARASAGALAPMTRPLGFDEHRWSSLLKWRLQKLHDLFSFPDRGIWRLPSAVRLAIRLHRRFCFDAVFSSGMPFSDHMIGLCVQNAIRRPWLADFRDPWVEYIHWEQWQGRWGHRLTRWAESAVLRRASWIVSVNDAMTTRFKARYSAPAARKCVTIANGFDPEDFPRHTDETPRRRFRLLYAGSLYKTRSPVNILAAFRRFLETVPGSGQHAQFDFAGRPGAHANDLTKPTDNGAVRYLGMLTHSQALAAMASADVNVVLLPNLPGSENDTTTKVYECLGSGRAVLAVVPLHGAAAAVLREHDGVWLCDPDDVDDITRKVIDMYRRWLAGNLRPQRSPEALKPLTREYQARQLAACLDAVAPIKRRAMGVSR